MKLYYQDEWTTLYCGDCLEVMAGLDESSIDTVITDPPYGLEFMGKEWDKLVEPTRDSAGGFLRNGKSGSNPYAAARIRHGEDVNQMQEWHYQWAIETLRVVKPGASMLAMGGTRTHHRLMCAIEDAGWEIRDCLMWLYGTGFPKSHNISKAIDKAAGAEREIVGQMDVGPDFTGDNYHRDDGQRRIADLTIPATFDAQLWDGWGTALKPAYEPIILAMKPRDGTFVNNALRHGVAGLWIDGGRIGTNKDVPASPSRTPGNSLCGSVDGSLRNETGNEGGHNPNLGRWPANIILDEEAAEMLDEQTGVLTSGSREAGFYTSAGANCYGEYAGCDRPEVIGNNGGASRFFYCAKASKSERTTNGNVENKHPTVKPISLMQYLCRLTKTPTGGTILDPFTGSGTTLLAARLEGRKSIGIEKNPEYCQIAAERLAIQNKELQ